MRKYIYSQEENKIKEISVFLTRKDGKDIYLHDIDLDLINTGEVHQNELEPELLFDSYSECKEDTIHKMAEHLKLLEDERERCEFLSSQYSDEEEYNIPEFEIKDDEILIIYFADSSKCLYDQVIYGITSDGSKYKFQESLKYTAFGDMYTEEIQKNYNGRIVRFKHIKMVKKSVLGSIDEIEFDPESFVNPRKLDMTHPKSMMNYESKVMLAFSIMKDTGIYITGQYDGINPSCFIIDTYKANLQSCFEHYRHEAEIFDSEIKKTNETWNRFLKTYNPKNNKKF